MSFKNKSIYIIPGWIDNYKNFVCKLVDDNRFCPIKVEERPINYLLVYAQKIFYNNDNYQEFRYNDIKNISNKLFGEESELVDFPALCDIRVAIFSTGVVFFEFWIDYKSLSVDKIIEFAYKFKKANKRFNNKVSLVEIVQGLLPEIKLFFNATSSFKQECDCFHTIKLEYGKHNIDELNRWIYLLSWSYNHSFEKANFDEENHFEMTYSPYYYDNWGGSQNGLVNITYDIEDETTNYFINTYKPNLLDLDYRFMYLILLNQRYCAIEYISRISDWENTHGDELRKLNKKIVTLRTSFSFRVISDDKIFQNVYLKMYKILEIESLLADIRDNEEMMEVLRNEANMRVEKITNKVLFVISFLSIFSALIDAAGYFDRFCKLKTISTWLSFVCISIFIIICIFWILKTKKR
ncbi:MAG: hypothetical protein IJ423_02380 [Clostridia bacterium]|nr:hypothetical protein [Clostridia bacterium]